jgi:hypothetical protein
VFGNCTKIVIYPRVPGVPRDLSVVNSVGPIISSAAYKELRAISGFNLIP